MNTTEKLRKNFEIKEKTARRDQVLFFKFSQMYAHSLCAIFSRKLSYVSLLKAPSWSSLFGENQYISGNSGFQIWTGEL